MVTITKIDYYAKNVALSDDFLGLCLLYISAFTLFFLDKAYLTSQK